jgi:hypothetical protein
MIATVSIERLRKWTTGSKLYRGWMWSAQKVGESTNLIGYDVCFYHRRSDYKFTTMVVVNKYKNVLTLKQEVEKSIDCIQHYGADRYKED